MKRTLIVVSALLIFIAIALTAIILSRSNNQPVAESKSVTTQEDTPISVILNGSDPDGDSLSFYIVKEPSHGSLRGTGAKMVYTPEKISTVWTILLSRSVTVRKRALLQPSLLG